MKPNIRREFLRNTGKLTLGLTTLGLLNPENTKAVSYGTEADIQSYNVKDFGAKGDGVSLDTIAIQKTIDTCSAKGGGTVLFPQGTFVSGTIVLKNKVRLYLTHSAVLSGSTNLQDYLPCECVYENLASTLILSLKSEYISIVGEGIIKGNGKAFDPKKLRPVLIRFIDCTDILIRDIKLRDSCSLTVFPSRCKNIRIEGIDIHNKVQHNNDGIDLDGCEDAFISNCHVVTEDDSIAFKTITKGYPCRRVVITNCILSSDCAAIRIGCESRDDNEQVTISNCVIHDTGLNGIKLQMVHGGSMRDLTFSNIVMNNVNGPISIRHAGWEPRKTMVYDILDDTGWEKATLKNILFENIRASVLKQEKWSVSITGTPFTTPENIRFNNVDITFAGGGTAEDAKVVVPEIMRNYPETFMFGTLPAYGFYIRHVKGITFNDVRFNLATGDKRPAIVCDDVTGLDIQSMKVQADADAAASIRLINSKEVSINNSGLLSGMADFLNIEGAESKNIKINGKQLKLDLNKTNSFSTN